MKTKLHLSSNTSAKRIIKCHGIFSFLIILFLTVSSFGQVSSISFEFCGGAVTFGTEDGRDANGFPYWNNGIDNQNVGGYTLNVEFDDNRWVLKNPGTDPSSLGEDLYVIDDLLKSICETTNWEPQPLVLPCSSLPFTVSCTPGGDTDSDGDGYYASIDCNDSNPTIYPGAPELCDGIDNNCNGQVNEDLPVTTYYVDADGDGYGTTAEDLCFATAPAGYATVGGDCDDTNAAINPGATEDCHDTVDNDCDSSIDEQDETCGEVISYCNADQTKVLICHNGKNKCVQINALDAHLAHGDTLGSCDGDPYEGDLYTKSTKGKTSNTDEAVLGFTTRVWPNPSGDDFNIKITTADNLNGVDVQVIDMTGKMIHNAYINYNENYKFGSKFESGVYFVKLIQGKNTQVKKVIKR